MCVCWCAVRGARERSGAADGQALLSLCASPPAPPCTPYPILHTPRAPRTLHSTNTTHPHPVARTATPPCSGACPAGRYGSGGSSSAECSGACPAGRWGGEGSTSVECAGQCQAGRYGTGGAFDKRCDGACEAGRCGSCCTTVTTTRTLLLAYDLTYQPREAGR